MARKIVVDPVRLKNVEKKLRNHASTYEADYFKLLTDVDRMHNYWQGADNIIYVKQIRRLEKDFKRNVDFMRQYAEYLKLSAETYENVQKEIITQAKGLIN